MITAIPLLERIPHRYRETTNKYLCSENNVLIYDLKAKKGDKVIVYPYPFIFQDGYKFAGEAKTVATGIG